MRVMLSVLLVVLPVSVVSASVQYSITDLGSLTGSPISHATAINGSGTVVGYSLANPGADPQGFLYAAGVSTGLGSSYVNGINDAGDIVGSLKEPGDGGVMLYQAFRHMATGGFSMVFPANHFSSSALSINATGEMAGDFTPSSTSHGFFINKGNVIDLDVTGANQFSNAVSITNDGKVVGTANTSTGSRAYIFDSTLYDPSFQSNDTTFIPTFGGRSSSAAGINQSGDVAGYAQKADSTSHAFLYHDGTLTDLGTLGGTESFANAINNLQTIVGFSDDAAGLFVPFIYMPQTGMTGISFVGSTLVPTSFTGINDTGAIVGDATDAAGNSHAVLLTPVSTPEPTSAFILVAVGAYLLITRRQDVPVIVRR